MHTSRPIFISSNPRVFFGYKQSEPEPEGSRIEMIYEALKEESFETFRDRDSIRLSENWQLRISEALKVCDAGVVVWSANAATSPEFLGEAGILHTRGKFCGIVLGELPEIPEFHRLQMTFLHDWTGDRGDARWRQLVNHIRSIAAKPGWEEDHPYASTGFGAVSPGHLQLASGEAREFREAPELPVMVRMQTPATVVLGQLDPGFEDQDWGWGVSRVQITSSFAVSITPISNAAWRAAILAGAQLSYNDDDSLPDQAPRTNIFYREAEAYVSWLNYRVGGIVYRLPSEAEWELAMRSGAVRRGEPCVREWVADAGALTHAGASANGSAREASHTRTRMVRGAYEMTRALEPPIAFRVPYGPTFRDLNVGFRVVRRM